jgi:TolA-binding protein
MFRMTRHPKSFTRCLAGLVLLVCLLGSARAKAAALTDTNAFTAALNYFTSHDWPRAETNFANFLKRFPQSPRYGEAVLYEAQAIFYQAKTSQLRSYDEVIRLLAAEQGKAADWADAFAYWTAMAWYWKPDYRRAADVFGHLAQDTNSSFRPEAVYLEADCYGRLQDWPRVVENLQSPEGAFQQLVKTDPTNEWAAKGVLLLGEAQLAQKNYDAAEAVLGGLPEPKLKPELEWWRQDLKCRIKIESGHPKEALLNSTNLLMAAGDDAEKRAKSVLLLGGVYRDLEQFTYALDLYTKLAADPPAPMGLRREAVLNGVDLYLWQNQTTNAARMLDNFLAAYPVGNINSDFDRLMLGEIFLKMAHETAGGGTNLNLARTNFEKIIADYPASEHLGRAYLDLGWCLLAETNLPASQAAFSNAVMRLTNSNDRATARFKLADTLYQQADFAGAIDNYNRIVDDYGSFPLVTNNLFEPALYQILRASIATTNLTAASEALDRILKWFPNGFLGDRSLLLLGEAKNRAGNAEAARELFGKFKDLWPDSPLRPQAELAVARTYEQQGDWTNAVHVYYGWIAGHTNSDALPLAEFSLAWAEFKAGQETNALRDFTRFVTNYPTNELVARAQYWMGDYYRQQGQLNEQFSDAFYKSAESNYQNVYLNWPASELYYHAQMEAGRTAFLRQDYSGAATNYFAPLVAEAKCPPDLKKEAAFACGEANFSANNFFEARNWFNRVASTYTNDPVGIRAWGRVGDSCRQLAALAGNPADSLQYYMDASNAYNMVLSPPLNALADISVRSLADYGLGLTLQKMARLKTGAERKELLQSAMDHYLSVALGSNLLPGEGPDLNVVRDAGLAAGELLETDEQVGSWEKASYLYRTLRRELSSDSEALEFLDKKIENARKHLPADKAG